MTLKKSFSGCFSALFFTTLFSVFAAAQNAAAYLTEPTFSPDRREIAFVSGGDIWTVPATGGTASLLVSHPATESRPRYSPDGRKLAFVSNRTGGGDIYVLDFASGDLQRITFDDVLENLDGWSPDGKWLYFHSTGKDISGMNDIFRVAAEGGTPQQVSADRYTNEFFAAPAPDGERIAFSARGIANGQWWRNGRSHIDESEIWIRNGDGSYEQIAPRGAKQLWPMWSADGARLFYVSDRSGAQNIWTRPLKGEAKQLTNFKSGRVLWPSISYDGRQIVFERDFKIWTLDTDGAKAREISITLRGAPAGTSNERKNFGNEIDEFSLSPDGKKIALVAHGEIFAAPAKDGGEAVRITETAAPESFAVWTPDSQKLIYVSERNDKLQLFQYDFGTETETRLTETGDDYAPVVSPDGKYIAFLRSGRSLRLYEISSKQEREIAKLYTDVPPLVGKQNLAWSPDSRWVAFLSYNPETRSYTNVSVASIDGQGARPLSFLANSNSNSVSWSPDGEFILFDTSQRTEDGSLARIDLRLRTPRFREDQFRDLFKQENPQQQPQPTPASSPTPAASPTPASSPTAAPTPAQGGVFVRPSTTAKKDEDKKPTEIVFENIRRRLSIVPTGISTFGQRISPDGKTVLLLAASEGQFNLYTMPLDELAVDRSAKQITSTPAFKGDAQFSPDSREVYYLENGRVQIANLERGNSRPLALSLNMNVDFAAEKIEVFEQAWRFLRDNFYDEGFHGVDWNRVYSTYKPLIAGARTKDETRRLLSLMAGELNASHLGVFGPSGFTSAPVGKLGLRFDRNEYERSGRLKITEIITLSPADISKDIKVGDYLVAVDGRPVRAGVNLDELLENKVGKRVELEVSDDGAGANKRKAVVKPVSTGAEKNLLYRQWVEDNRAYVERASGGRLGYVHLPDMSSGTLAQLYIDLDAQNQSKEGVVVDIRNNNGGFINPYVLDILSRRGYLNMTERGFWTVPARSALGQRALERPTVLLVNQHSLSDAEDLTEGYRALNLGRIVGEPTAGWIIFTWNVQTFDGTTVRLPRQKITDGRGRNMELSPRPVDVQITRPIGETLTGKDSQLDAAVGELLRQIAK